MANPQPDKYIKLSTELWQELCKIRIPGEARQMLDVIVRKTYGYQKKEDRISTSQIMELTGLSELGVRRARKRLLEMNLITMSNKGHSQILNYSIQKDYDKWKPCPKKDTLSNNRQRGVQKSAQRVSKKARHNTINIQKKYFVEARKKIEPQVKDFLKYFGDKFKELFGFTYPCNFGKDGKIAKDLLKLYNFKILKDLVDVAFDWAKEGGWLKDKIDIGIFKSQLSKILIKYRQEYEVKEEIDGSQKTSGI